MFKYLLTFMLGFFARALFLKKNAEVSSIRVWNRCLTEEEIKMLHTVNHILSESKSEQV